MKAWKVAVQNDPSAGNVIIGATAGTKRKAVSFAFLIYSGITFPRVISSCHAPLWLCMPSLNDRVPSSDAYSTLIAQSTMNTREFSPKDRLRLRSCPCAINLHCFSTPHWHIRSHKCSPFLFSRTCQWRKPKSGPSSRADNWRRFVLLLVPIDVHEHKCFFEPTATSGSTQGESPLCLTPRRAFLTMCIMGNQTRTLQEFLKSKSESNSGVKAVLVERVADWLEKHP